MDINLPGISGTVAMQILRDDPATAHPPELAFSANAVHSQISNGLDAASFRYLAKPIMAGEFMDAQEFALKYSTAVVRSTEKKPRA